VTEYKCYGLTPAGRILIAHVAKTDGTDAQDWYFDYSTGVWHYSCALLSKVDAPTAVPIPWANKPINVNQSRRYIFAPDGANTNVYRQFQPEDLLANPKAVNTSEKLHYGAFKLRTLPLDLLGPIESDKALLRLLYGGNQISAAAGPIAIDIATDGLVDPFTSVQTVSFTTAYEAVNIPSSGLSYRIVVLQVTLNNGSTNEGNAETNSPVSLPLVFEGAAKHAVLREFIFELDMVEMMRLNGAEHLTQISALIDAKASGSGVRLSQQLLFGRVDRPVTITGYVIQKTGKSTITLQEVPGGTS
jgi:hypothetical protein